MKKSFILIAAIAIGFVGCNKSSDDATPDTPVVTTPTPSISAVPSTFTTKVMIEENTGAWCGWCVLGADGISKAIATYPGRVNAVALHGGGNNEPMMVPEYASMLTFSGATGVPHYQLNRGTGGGFPGSFSSNVSAALNVTATCGLAIDARESSGSTVKFTVHAGFNAALTGDYRLIAYLIEDSVKNSATGYNQSNYVNGDPSFTTNFYYTQPNPITNYTHKHVARKLLSASMQLGDTIPAASVQAGKEFVKTYSFTIPAGTTWDKNNLSAIVGIMKYSNNCSDQKIINSQEVKLGSLKNWD